MSHESRATRFAALLLAGIMAASSAPVSAESLSWRFVDAFGVKGPGRNELRNPVDVALTEGREVAVLDANRESVVIFDDSGRWLRNLGGRRGEGGLELQRPTALTIDEDGRFWAADSGNHRLVIFDEKGEVESTVGGLGAKDGRFHNPLDITIGQFGKVYVADSRNQRIQVLRSDGSFVDSWASRTGGRRRHLDVPQALAYTAQGRGGIWVANRGWQRLERFDLDGEWVESLDLSALVEGEVRVEGLEIDPVYHRMFVSDSAGGRLIVLDRRGALLAELRGPGDTPLEPGGAAVNRKFDVYIPDTAGARVLKYRAGSRPARE